jgi:hypothetical protein
MIGVALAILIGIVVVWIAVSAVRSDLSRGSYYSRRFSSRRNRR